MSFDSKAAQKFLETLSGVKSYVAENKELVNSERIREIDKIQNDFSRAVTDAETENRKLRIGIIGSVKAGKSSFLNAMFFDGKDILPKACTPMTAALTRISYAEQPSAKIHFYKRTDWNDISNRAAEYDKRLDEAYQKYCSDIEAKNKKSFLDVLTADMKDLPKIQPQPKNAFKKTFDKDVDETLLGSKELIEMAGKNPAIISRLETVDEIKGDNIMQLISEINQYVGASGKYTPIVNYVELFIDSEDIDGLEIIDTPGLNDPVVSRGIVTKEFLAQCDVAILLSPCMSFMPESDIALMTCALPSANINDFIVVGSKLDSGVLDDNRSPSFKSAVASSVKGYKASFESTVARLQQRSPNSKDIAAIASAEVKFVSSMLFAIYRKKENGFQLNNEERKVISNLSRWKDFDPDDKELLLTASGIDDVSDVLYRVKDRKNEIFEKNNEELIDSFNDKLQRILNDIISDSAKNKRQIEMYDADELKKRYSKLNSAIDIARSQLSSTFDSAAADVQKSAAAICARMRNDMQNYNSPIKVKKEVEENVEKERCGWFNKDVNVITTHTNIYTASLSEGIKKLTDYIARCNNDIIEDYDKLFNFDKLTKSVKKIIIAPFSEKDNFNEMDIQLSLDKLRNQLTIPPRDAILLNDSIYIDRLRSKFSYSNSDSYGDSSSTCTVSGKDVDRLSTEISSTLTEIESDFANIIIKNSDLVSECLKAQATKFANDIKTSFGEDFDKLSKQIMDKTASIEKYSRFIQKTEDILINLSGVQED